MNLFVFVATASEINKPSSNLSVFNVKEHPNVSILSEEIKHFNCTRTKYVIVIKVRIKYVYFVGTRLS